MSKLVFLCVEKESQFTQWIERYWKMLENTGRWWEDAKRCMQCSSESIAQCLIVKINWCQGLISLFATAVSLERSHLKSFYKTWQLGSGKVLSLFWQKCAAFKHLVNVISKGLEVCFNVCLKYVQAVQSQTKNVLFFLSHIIPVGLQCTVKAHSSWSVIYKVLDNI